MNFEKTIKHYQLLINKSLDAYLSKKISQLPSFNNPFVTQQYGIFRNYCLGSGKRLRPILTLMAYKAVGGKKEKEIIVPALAFELFHNYTLVHDDIYDEDSKRRGNLANHILLQRWFEKKYGKHSSENILFKNNATRFGVVAGIINGKYLHFLSSLPILESNISERKKVAGIRLHQSVSMIDNTGQAIDLYFEERSGVKEKDYYDMVLCKTGKLFKSAIEWGAILGNATSSQRMALSKYIEELAIVFQIKDDLLDIDSEGKKGRDIGSDIRKGKKTLLIINTLKRANLNQQKEILSVLGDKKASDAKIKRVILIINKLGSVDYCQNEAKRRLQKAIQYLDKASPRLESTSKQFLCEMAYFMLERNK